MIEQQYYTRERGGLFSERDGYDTIAKSSGLKLDFIKKHLHPFCSYDLPSELQKNGETDETKYPAHFIVVPVPTGEMIVGQAVYKNKDFTGLRSAFFMHNYVLDEQEKMTMLNDPKKLFGITSFKESYDINLGRELAALSTIPYEENNPLFTGRTNLLEQLGMTDNLFEKLLYAVYIAAASKKKIYICLNVTLQELNRYSKALLYHIYTHLPRIILKDLGVSTYAKSTEIKKGINILFLDKETLKQGDSRIDKELVFDFVNQRFLNVDISEEQEKFFELVFRYAANKEAWRAINAFIEKIAEGMEGSTSKNMPFHQNALLLFEMQLYRRSRKEYELKHRSYRNDLLKNIVSYIKLKVDEETKRQLMELMEYTIKMLEREVAKGELFSLAELSEIISFKQQICPDEESLITLLVHNLEQASSAYAYAKEVLTMVNKDSKLHARLFKKLYEKDELKARIVYRIIEDTLKAANTPEQFIAAMNTLSTVENIVQEDSFYEQTARKVFALCMKNADDKVKLLNKVQRWCKDKHQKIYLLLLKDCEQYFIEKIDLKTIDSEETLMGLGFKNKFSDSHFKVIELYQSFKHQTFSAQAVEKTLLKETQELIRHYYSADIRQENFYMLVNAFLVVEEETYGSQKLTLDIDGVLNYLMVRDSQLLLRFIIWGKDQSPYINPATFDKDVVQYFLKLKKNKEKVPLKELKNKLSENPKTKRLYRKIKESQQSKVERFLERYKRIIAAFSILFICVLVGARYFVYQHSKEREKIKSEPPAVTKDTIDGQNSNIDETDEDQLKQKSTNQEGANQESTNQESTNQESTNQESANQESTNQESANQEDVGGEGSNLKGISKENPDEKDVNEKKQSIDEQKGKKGAE